MLDEIKKHLNFNRLVVLVFVVVGFVIYGNTLLNQMFWDDFDFILNNLYLRDWQYLPNFFSENVIAGAGLASNYWRPVLQIVFSFEWHTWGDFAPAYHFVNIIFHVSDATLLYFVLNLIFKKKWLSVVTALVFLVHPLQTEAVSYVNSLGDSLSVFWMLGGTWFYLKYLENANRQYYCVSAFFYILALMSKETAIIMPALLALAHFFVFPKEIAIGERAKKIVKKIWPFFLMAGIYLLLRATSLNFINSFNLYNEQNVFTSSIFTRIFTFFHILTIYLGLLFWPVGLHMERTISVSTSLSSGPVILGALIFLGLLTLAIWNVRKYPILSFGILWFFIGLAPTSNIAVPINGMLYEHWLYFPMIGIALIIIWLGMGIFEKFHQTKILFIALLIISISTLSVLTIKRNRQWHDPIVFYNQTLTFTPGSYRVLNNLGMAYADAKDSAKAKETYEKAMATDPKNPIAYHNLANIYRDAGEKSQAIEIYEQAISLDSKFMYSYSALIDLYLKEKNYPKALEYLKKAQELQPENENIKNMIYQLDKLK
ncbi:MAG: tetratricopeptide repeat protein [Candidatus Moraniibacteriota bacterium]